MPIQITKEEYQKKFGSAPDFSSAKQVQPTKQSGLISEAFDAGMQKVKSGFQQSQQASQNITDIPSAIKGAGNILEGSVRSLAGGVEALSAPLAPITAPIGKAVNYTADKISDNSSVQKFAMSKAGQATSRAVENISNVNTIAGAVAGSKTAMKIPGAIESKVGSLAPKGISTGGIAGEIIPTADRIVNSQVSKALDLTQGDIKNISMSTGNEVGRFMADNNLIGGNKDLTVNNVKNFFEANYKQVRSEIGKVTKLFDKNEVPAVKEALGQIKREADGVVGLQDLVGEVDTLLSKSKYKLDDIQRVKELMDDHFSLYKATGDVKEGVTKSGLAKVRGELQNFIEQKVKDNTGIDIKKLNNNVSTARSITDAIETRSTRGLTRSNLKIGDLGVFGVGMGMGGPLTGVGLVIGKKIMESPSFRLKFSKWLDSKSDSAKIQIQNDLEAGRVPQGVKVIQSSKSNASQNLSNQNTAQSANVLKSDIGQRNIKSNNTAPATNTSNRTMSESIPQNKTIGQRITEAYKKSPFSSQKGGVGTKMESRISNEVKIGDKVFKEVPDATKREMVELMDYLNLKKEPTKVMEYKLDKILEKYNINPDWSVNKIADTLEKLVEGTKTK